MDEEKDKSITELAKMQNIMNTFNDFQESLLLTPTSVRNILDAEDYEPEETPAIANMFNDFFVESPDITENNGSEE